MRDFRDCLNKITNNNLKKGFINEIHDKVRTQILAPNPPYNDFDTKCPIP
jgi:hypothetical protein